LRTPSDDEIAERLKRQTRARLKESRQLPDATKQMLRKTWKGRWLRDGAATDSERRALGQRDDLYGRLETSDLLLGRGGLHVSHELVDAGETFGRVVPFDCHLGPCLSWEKKSIATSTPTPMFCFAQSEEQAVVAALALGPTSEPSGALLRRF
jgi:hypothetical protein